MSRWRPAVAGPRRGVSSRIFFHPFVGEGRVRILFLCNSRFWGGGERYVITVAERLASRGHDSFVAVPADSPLWRAAEAAGQVTALPLAGLGAKLSRRSAPDFALRWPLYARRLRRSLRTWIAAHRLELIHLQYKKEQLLGSRAARRLGLRVVWTEHGPLPRPLSALRLPLHLYRRAADAADRIICVSRFVMADLSGHGVSRSRLRLCQNGIEPAADPPRNPMALRATLGFGPDEPIVGTVSRLVPGKGLADLVQAMPRVMEAVPGARLLIVGDGPDLRALKGRARRCGMEGRVVFAGHRSDATRLLHIMDVFVCPSHAEGLPYSVMEAMRAARPVVATRVGGLPELLADGEAGQLVNPRDPAALAAGIASLFSDAARRNALGQAARERLVTRFGIDAMIEGTEAVFEGARHGG